MTKHEEGVVLGFRPRFKYGDIVYYHGQPTPCIVVGYVIKGPKNDRANLLSLGGFNQEAYDEELTDAPPPLLM